MAYPKLVIGWQEWISLPSLNIPLICAKVDTGARTSSIHADNIEYFVKDGVEFVRFDIHPLAQDNSIIQHCESPLIDKRIVKSSSGDKEERPVINTTLHLANHKWAINLNLTNRHYMESRMLIGREALGHNTLVHAGIQYVHGKMTEKDARQIYKGNNQ